MNKASSNKNTNLGLLATNTDHRPDHCAVAACAELVSGKWTLLVIRDLIDGPKSYSDLANSLVGISPRTLCERLRQLAASGIVLRTRIKGLPPRSVYELTSYGAELVPLIEVMRSVGEILIKNKQDHNLLGAHLSADRFGV